MEYESSFPKGATLGGKVAAKQYATLNPNAVKQSEARELISRLNRIASELSNTYDLASNVADKVVGSRPEPVGAESNPTAVPTNFIAELRMAITRLENFPGEINSHLNRIDQSF